MRKLLLGSLVCFVLAVSSFAAAPHLISYQGRLTDPGGNPVANSTYSVIFRIYDDAVGGTTQWIETQNVTTSDGLFSVQLGSVSPLDPTVVFADSARYLSLQVGADPELTPRTRLTSVPYAFSAGNAGGWSDDGINVRLSTSTDRVGVGTASPQSKLHVIGDPADNNSATFEGSNDGLKSTVTGSDFVLSAIQGTAANSKSDGVGIGVEGSANGPYENRGVEAFAASGAKNVGIKTQSYGESGSINTGLYGHAQGGEETYGIDIFAGYANINTGILCTTDGGYVSQGLNIDAKDGNYSSVGIRADASGNGSAGKWGVIASATGLGTNYGLSAYAEGGSYNIAGWFSKGNTGVQPAANSIVAMENSANGYLSIITPDINERGILFGEPSNEAAGGIIYNAGSVPAGLSFRVFNNTTRMVLTSGGRIGTNILTPEAGLHIRGTGFPASFGYFDTYGTTQDAGLRFYEAGVAKSHLYHNASTNTLDLFGDGFTGISISAAGNVGIGTFTPNYKLDVRGTIGNNATLYHSDARWKKNVKTLSGSLDRIQKLRGVSFDWKRNDFTDMNFPEGEQIGLIAQEVEEVVPEVVNTAADGYKSVDYAKLVALLIEANKEQQQQIEELKTLVRSLVESSSNKSAATYGQK